MSRYTGRLQTFEEKFTYNVPMCTNIEITIPNVTIGVNTANFQLKTPQQLEFEEVFSENGKKVATGDNLIDDSIDSNLLRYSMKNVQTISTANPNRFISQIALVIDSISFQTYSYYESATGANPMAILTDRANLDTKAFTSMLPIQVAINGKQVSFDSSDGINDFKMVEYGEFETIPSQTINTGEFTPPMSFNGTSYTQTYGKSFELTSFPDSISVDLDFNGNMFSNYYKDIYYRGLPYTANETIDRVAYYFGLFSNFRIDYRVIQTIDYQTNETLLPSRPQRIVKEELNLQTLTRLLKSLKAEEEPVIDVLKLMSKEEAEYFIEQMKQKVLDSVTANNYIDVIKDRIEL